MSYSVPTCVCVRTNQTMAATPERRQRTVRTRPMMQTRVSSLQQMLPTITSSPITQLLSTTSQQSLSATLATQQCSDELATDKEAGFGGQRSLQVGSFFGESKFAGGGQRINLTTTKIILRLGLFLTEAGRVYWRPGVYDGGREVLLEAWSLLWRSGSSAGGLESLMEAGMFC